MNAQTSTGRRPRRSTRILLAGLMIATLSAGCSDQGVKSVDLDGARRALRTTLDAWKNRESIESLKERSPSIVAQDLDWESGAALDQFEMIDDGKEKSVNLQIPVELTLRDKAGKVVKKKVKYLVGTSPIITVFREIR